MNVTSSLMNANYNMMPMVQQSQASSLTTEQQDTITSVLAEYDSSTLTTSDAQSIVAAFEEAGIQPSREMANAMEAAGFDAREVGDLAGVGGPQGHGGMPPPPPASSEEISELSSVLDSLLTTEEDEESTTTATTSTAAFDEVMEYTSRIINLNDDSRDQVMDILDQYSTNGDQLSQEELALTVKDALSSILGDENNYNHVSFYA